MKLTRRELFSLPPLAIIAAYASRAIGQPQGKEQWPRFGVGVGLRRIPVARVGQYGDFEINRKNLSAIVANFRARGDRTIVVDINHASENPRSMLKLMPVVGFVNGLDVDRDTLFAEVQWTPSAKRMVEDMGAHPFISPAITYSGNKADMAIMSIGIVPLPEFSAMEGIR